MTDSSCSQSVHKGSKWLGMGSATQLALRAGTQGTHIAFVIPKCFTLHPSQQVSTRWRMQKGWETLQWGAGSCHRNNTSEPQPEEPVGRRVACVPVPELCWWQQLIPNCSSAGDCFGLVGCRQKMWVPRDRAYGSRFVSYRNSADEERDWIPCAASGQLSCTILANYVFLLKNICG